MFLGFLSVTSLYMGFVGFSAIVIGTRAPCIRKGPFVGHLGEYVRCEHQANISWKGS